MRRVAPTIMPGVLARTATAMVACSHRATVSIVLSLAGRSTEIQPAGKRDWE